MTDYPWGWNRARADGLLRNEYSLNGYRTVVLPADPTWAETAGQDRGWIIKYQALAFTQDLLGAWHATKDERYLDRYTFLLRDWYLDNPRAHPASSYSWSEHAVAWRAMVYACAYEVLGPEPWLVQALEDHAAVLADPPFYVGHGNHALDENIGLLSAGCELQRAGWVDLAITRIEALVRESIDAQGVTNEGSIQYQTYNWNRYGEALIRIARCARKISPDVKARDDRMLRFLVDATMPNGEYVTIGDTEVIRSIALSLAPELTQRLMAVYQAGFAFGRSALPAGAAPSDATFYSVRFGVPSLIHGHVDGGSMTLYANGSRLLVDPGLYRYEPNKWRKYFIGPWAHNVVAPEGVALDRRGVTDLVGSSHTDSLDFIAMRNHTWNGVTWDRQIAYSRAGGYFVLQDQIHSASPTTFHQLWHLMPDSSPVLDASGVTTTSGSGNVSIRWLGRSPSVSIVSRRFSPIQGWFSWQYATRVPAPVVDASEAGSDVRFLTLIVPFGRALPDLRVLRASAFPGGFNVGVIVGGRTETIAARAGVASLTSDN